MWASKLRRFTGRFIKSTAYNRKPNAFRLFNPFAFKTIALFAGGIGVCKYFETRRIFMNNIPECQGTKIEYSNPNVRYLNHPIIPFLMSRLRDPKCTAEHFRVYSDRIMQLLIEEAISQEPFEITQELASTGAYFEMHLYS